MALDIKVEQQPKKINSLSPTSLEQLKTQIKVFRDETLVFRNQTQAIKNDTDVIATTIANIEDNIESIEINITNLQQATEDDRILVQAALASCQQILIDVTALKNLTEGFKDDAESAATQTALDAIATAADRVQTGLDVLATNADVVQTGLDRVATGADVVTTGNNVDLSEAWAESPTEPGGIGTKSAKTWANEAEGHAEDAETAKNAITDKFDLTGWQEGDILRVNSIGIAEKISPVELFKSTGPFLKSPMASESNFQHILGRDSFNRADENPITSPSDSGLSWSNLVGTNACRIQNSFLRETSFPSSAVLTIDNTALFPYEQGLYIKFEKYFSSGTSGNFRLIVGQDTDNYIYIDISTLYQVGYRILGVDYQISSTGATYTLRNYVEHKITIRRVSVTSAIRVDFINNFGSTQYSINLDPVFASFNPATWNKVGFLFLGQGSSRFVKNIKIQRQ